MRYPIILTLCLALFITGCASSQTNGVYQHRMDKIVKQNEKLKQQTSEEMRISRELPFILFEFDSTKLSIDSYNILDKVAEIMESRKFKLVVEGNADQISSNEYNDWLANKRIAAVKSYLVGKGVHPDSIKTYGAGKRKPLVDLTTVEARQLNRRVDLMLTTRKWDSIY